MHPAIHLAHFQLTLRCNLRCPFCGQWGKTGYAKELAPRRDAELTPAEWIDAAHQILRYGEPRDAKPDFLFWGGEPLLYEGLEPVADAIVETGSRLGIVTNGVLLERHADLIARRMTTLYLSLDGPGEEHSQVRGTPGIHLAIERGMDALKGSKTRKVCLSTISEWNWNKMPATALYAERLGFDRIIFQNLIFLLPHERDAYNLWLRERFGVERSRAESWTFDEVPAFARELPAALDDLENRRQRGEFQRIQVDIQPVGLSGKNVLARMRGEENFLHRDLAHCLASERHINVGPDGSVRFCVDYNDVDLGNLRENPLAEILDSEQARRFREDVAAGRNPACHRCPWRYNENYTLD